MKKLLLPSALLFTTSLFAQPAIADSVAIPYEDLADTAAYYYEDKQGYDDFSFDPANLENFEFNGKIYKVYPYVIEAPFVPSVEEEVAAPAPLSKKELKRMKKNGYDPIVEAAYADSAKAYEDNAPEVWDGEIPPLAYQIPDSVYVLLQKQNDGSRKVRAVFAMQNNLLQGLASFFDENSLISKEGSYNEGIKQGQWQSYLNVNGVSVATSTEIYVDGHKNGYYKKYAQNKGVAYLQDEGEYKMGEVETNKYYELKSDYSTYLHSEKAKNDSLNIYRYYYDNGSLFYEMISPFSITRYYEIPVLKYCQITEIDACTSDFQVPSYGTSTYYYRNGNLLAKFSSKSDSIPNYVLFDTVYGYNHEVLAVQRKINDSLGIKRFELIGYNKQGQIMSILRHIDEEYYREYPYETIERNKEGVLEIEKANYDRFYSSNESKALYQPYLINVEKSARRGIVSYVYRISPFDRAHFVKIKSLQADFSVDYNITNSTPEHFAFQNIVYFGDAKMVMYSHQDTIVNKQWKDISLTGLMRRATRGNEYFVNDSVKFYYKNKLFSGDVRLFFGNGKNLMHLKGGKLAIDLMAIELVKREFKNASEREKRMLKSYIDFSFKKGDITFISLDFQEKKEHISAQAYLKNSALHGKAFAQNEKVNSKGELKKKERMEMDFYEGLPHGIFKEERWNKETNKWNIRKLEHYCNGVKCDTAFRYREGVLTKVEIYTKEGSRTGEWKEFNQDGKLESVSNYNYGVLHGPSFKFNESGDTIAFSNYENGKREGAFVLLSNDNHFTLKGFTINGKINGILILKDGNGVVRMKAHIKDQLQDASDYIHVSDLLKSDISDLKCEGTFEFYYANGAKYCEAHTKLDSAYLNRSTRLYNDVMHNDVLVNIDSANSISSEEYTVYPPLSALGNQDFEGTTQIKNNGIIKTGVWKYYYLDGALRYKITYIDSNKVKVGKDTIYGCAEYLEYFNDGQLMAKGMVLQEGFVQECESDLFEVDYKVLYTDFYNAAGKPIMKNSTGTIIKYFSNQMVHEEGKYINGKKDGWWKEYNREGKLIFVGRYVNGLPDGRHLRGDLEGINYLDDRCFENMQKEQEAIEESQYYLEINETFYKNGINVKSNYYNFKRAGDSGALQNLEMR